jgi:hypothetical protein
MATRIGSIFADFTAKTAGFQQGLEQVQAGMKKTSRSVADNTAAIKASFAQINAVLRTLGVGISVGAIVNGLKAIGSQIADVKDGATELGTSYKDFQILQYAAEYSEEAMNTLKSSLDKLDNSIQKARNEGGSAAKTFKDMGVSIEDLNALTAGQRFTYIAQDIKNAIDPSARFAQWVELLGAKALLKLKKALDNASVGYEELARRTEQVGIIADETIQKYDTFIKRWEKGKKTLVVGLLDIFETGSFNIDLMNGKLDEMASKLETNADKSELYTKAMIAMEKHGGFSKQQIESVENMAVKYNLLASEERFQAAQAAKAAAEEKKYATTLGQTKDEIEEINRQYSNQIDKLGALKLLYNGPLAKSKEQQIAIGEAIRLANEAVDKSLQSLIDGAMTAHEKFAPILDQLILAQKEGRITQDMFDRLFLHYAPTAKEATESTLAFNAALAEVDPAYAYQRSLEQIDEQFKKIVPDANTSVEMIQKVRDELRKTAYENSAAGKLELSVQTPEQVKQRKVDEINKSGATPEVKEKALYDLDTGFVDTQKQLVEQARELQNQQHQWTEVANAAAEAEAAYNSATTIEQLNQTKNALDQVQNKYTALGEVGNRAVEGLAAGFARLIVQGGSVKDMLMGVVQMIAEMMLQQAMLSAFRSVGVAGWFAGGGDVDPNKYYVVGENGPELFSPKARGTIINDTQINARSSGGNSAPVIQFNLSAYDTIGMSQMIDSKTPSIIAQAMRTWKYENSRGKM